MTPCPLLDGLYGICYSLEAQGQADQAAHLRAVAKELRETRGYLRLTQNLLAMDAGNDALPQSHVTH